VVDLVTKLSISDCNCWRLPSALDFWRSGVILKVYGIYPDRLCDRSDVDHLVAIATPASKFPPKGVHSKRSPTYCVLWIHCNSTRSPISAIAELLFIQSYGTTICTAVNRFVVKLRASDDSLTIYTLLTVDGSTFDKWNFISDQLPTLSTFQHTKQRQ